MSDRRLSLDGGSRALPKALDNPAAKGAAHGGGSLSKPSSPIVAIGGWFSFLGEVFGVEVLRRIMFAFSYISSLRTRPNVQLFR